MPGTSKVILLLQKAKDEDFAGGGTWSFPEEGAVRQKIVSRRKVFRH